MKTKSIFRYLMLFVALGIMSCSSSDDNGGDGNGGNGNGGNGGNGDTTTITVETERDNLFVDTALQIIVRDGAGNDVTDSSTIMIDGTAITANPHMFTAEGDFVITATKGEASDDTGKTIKVVTPTHRTKVLVEDYTGTWCGYCPRLAYKLDQLSGSDSDVIPVAVHNDTPFGFAQVGAMENTFGVSGYPTGIVNRQVEWNESNGQVLSLKNSKKECGLAINSSISGSTLSVTAKAHYDIDAYRAHKLVVLVLENGLLYDQANYMNNDSSSPWYQAGNPIPNFEHNHTLRASLTNVLGDEVPSSDTVLGNTYSKDFTYNIPGGYNAANLEIVTIMVDNNNRVVNVQKVAAGSNKDFD